MIAHVHEGPILSGLPLLLDFSWSSADTFRRSLNRPFGGILSNLPLT
jgi:hypothetical protein